jgi:hypothetical protein
MSDSVLLADEHPVDPDDELLVAYLDGELNEAERRAVEKRLVSEPDFQRRMQSLETGWEWLEELPGEATDEKLVESTIELVVADIAPPKRTTGSWLARHGKTALFGLILALSLVAGVAGTVVAKWMALRGELRELAIAENHEAYKLHRPGDNFSLYRALAYNQQFHEMVAAMERIGERELVTPNIIGDLPVDQRDEAVEALPTEVREKLMTRWETYSGYDEMTKQQIRETARQVERQEDSELLLRTMKAAAVWIEGLGDDLRDRLNSSDETIRNQAIDEAIALTMAELGMDSAKLLSDQTCDQIYFWLRYRLRVRIEQTPGLAEAIEQTQAKTQKLFGRPVPIEWIEYPLLRYIVNDSRRGGRFFGYSWFSPPFAPIREFIRPGDDEDDPDAPKLQQISDEELEGLKANLDDQVIADLLRFTELLRQVAGEVAVNETLRTWASEAVRRSLPRPPSNEPGIVQRYQELSEKERERLDLSPPEAIRREVFDPPRDPWRSGRPPRNGR